MFSGHNIINKSSILFDIFIDHFEKTDKRIKIEFENSCEHSKNAADRKKYIIKIELNLDYISDSITFELQQIEKHITPQQVIERIDYRFDEYIPTVEKKISDIDENIEPMIAKLEKLETNIMELQKQCKSLLERNEELYHLYELSDVDTKQHYDEFLHFADHSNARDSLYYDVPNIAITFGNVINNVFADKIVCVSCEQHPNRFISGAAKFSSCNIYISDMKYFRTLKTLKITNCDTHDLSFLSVTPNLVEITINDSPELTSIEYLTKFPNLEKIVISGACKVRDLITLVNCPKLKMLKLPTGTNTGCFSKTITFEISMV